MKNWVVGLVVGIMGGIIAVMVLSLIPVEITTQKIIETITEETTAEIEAQQNDNIIFWNKSQPLNLTDFKGIVGGPNADDALAQSDIGFFPAKFNHPIVNFEPCQFAIVDYEIFAHFNKEKSWIKEKAKNKTHVLNHEQRHFDITEIYARIANEQINDEFLNKKFPCPNVNEELFESALKEESEYKILVLEHKINENYNKSQNTYEKETFWGNLLDPQIKWDKKIDECLAKDLNKIEECFELHLK